MINSLAGGGAERVMSTLLRHSETRADAHDLHLVLLDNEEKAYSIPSFVTVHQLDSKRSLARTLPQALKALRAIRPDVVLSFLTRANFANVATARLLGHRSVISERAYTSGHHGNGSSGLISRLLIKTLYPRASFVIGVSEIICQDLTGNFGVSTDRIIAIPNPVDADAVRQQGSEVSSSISSKPYIVGMGRLISPKNFSLLLQAFAQSAYIGNLVLLGQGPEEQKLRALAVELGISERVIFGGFRSNPFPIIAAAQAYVLPSNAEGFPNSLVEAMTLGVPVISTECLSGPSEILHDAVKVNTQDVFSAKYGILVPTQNVIAMSRAISMICKNEVQKDLSERARLGAARYRIETTVKSYWHAINIDGQTD